MDNPKIIEVRSTDISLPVVPEEPKNFLDLMMRPISLEAMSMTNHENDVLGMIEHKDPKGRFASGLFSRLDYVVSAIIKNDPELQKKFLEEDRVVIAQLDLDLLHGYELSRLSGKDAECVTYTVRRTDGGNENGGFYIDSDYSHGGSVIIKHEDFSIIDPEDNDYCKALGLLNGFSLALATEYNVLLRPGLSRPKHSPTGKKFYETIRKQNRLQSRLAASVKNSGKIVSKKIIKPVFTTPVIQDGKPSPLGERKIAIRRLIGLGLILPIPAFGISDAWYEPASLDLSVGAGAAIFNALNEEDIQRINAAEIKSYDKLKIDLPNEFIVDDSPSEVRVLSPTKKIEESAPISEYAVEETSNSDIGGQSPRILKTSGALIGGECMSVPLSEAAQGSDIAVVASDILSAKDLTIRKYGKGFKLCNPTTMAFSMDDRVFSVDIIGKDK